MANRLSLQCIMEDSSGFCFGVAKTIQIAEEQIKLQEDIYCLGQIVHNEEEVNRLKSEGLHTINKDELAKIKDSVILFRAHGEPPESFEKALVNNNKVIDATCPIVLKIQKRIRKSYLDGENIFIFGKKEHPEVIGLNGQTENTAFIFKELIELEQTQLPTQITLYSQTTMPIDRFRNVIDFFHKNHIVLKVHDTICRHVSNRKLKIEEFARQFSVIIFVGGRDSSNGKELFAYCVSANPNSYYISYVEEIDLSWFSNGQKVGICGATSTPKWLLERVKSHLESL